MSTISKQISRRGFLVGTAVATATVAATGLVGCGSASSASSADSAASTAAEVKARTDLNVALTAQPPAIDPLMTVGNVTAEVANNIFEGLYCMDASYKPQPLLATGCDVSSDGLTYTFTLKKDVKFHDGSTMTADDVVASMERWVKLNSRAKALFSDSKWEKAADDKVTFTITSPASDILIILSNFQQFAAVMPKAVVEAATETGVTDFIGTGPYQFNEWAQDQYVHLTKFADYHGAEGDPSGLAGARKAVAEDLYFHIAADDTTRVNALVKGQYDIIDSVPTSSYDALESNEDVKLETNTGGYLVIYMNTTKDSHLNEKMRQAVMKAIDCDAMLKSVYGDAKFYIKDYGYQNPEMTQWKVDGGKSWYDAFDLEAAKKAFADAGYNGETIRLITTGDYKQMADGTEFVSEALTKAGLTCEISSDEFAKYMERKADFASWDVCVCTQSYQTTPPQLNVVNPSFNGLDDQQILDGVKAIRAAKDDAAAAAEWSKVQERLYEHGAGYVVGHSKTIAATRANVNDYENFVIPVVYNAYANEA